MYVADVRAGEVLRVADGLSTVFLDGDIQPSAVEFHGGELYVSDFSDGSVRAYGAEGARIVRENRRSLARLEEPCAMLAHGGEVWVLGNDSRNLLVLGEDERSYGDERPLRGAHGFVVHGDEIFVASSPTEWGLGLVQVLDAYTGESLDRFAPWGELEEGTGIAVDGDTLLVVDALGDQVVRYAMDGEWLGVVADAADGLDRPVSVRVHDGVPWLLDQQGIWRLDRRGAVLEVPLTLDFARNFTVVED
ncbi:MAG: hypothetical protein EP330_18005 [Deltaproteobacteria bacterium]|nr:MAG: hypothetical protein EP330_18005 [Deltaproteobacteria bacterium]